MQSFVLLVLFLIPILVQAQSLEDIIIQQESEGVHWSISVIDEQGQSLESWNNQKMDGSGVQYEAHHIGCSLRRIRG